MGEIIQLQSYNQITTASDEHSNNLHRPPTTTFHHLFLTLPRFIHFFIQSLRHQDLSPEIALQRNISFNLDLFPFFSVCSLHNCSITSFQFLFYLPVVCRTINCLQMFFYIMVLRIQQRSICVRFAVEFKLIYIGSFIIRSFLQESTVV